MQKSIQHSWLPVAAIVGAVYALVGVTFALPSAHAQMWRWGAWGVSAAAYAAHICYERFWLRNPPGRAALHVALATALGAFGLAVSANIHSIQVRPVGQHPLLLTLSLGLWPVITGGPSFCVALLASWILARTCSRTESR